ncbi:TPA: DUF6543 domain-containing protein [Pseudomonas putida]
MPYDTIHPHQQFLRARLPIWASTLSATHWHALGDSLVPAQGLADNQADWFTNAQPALRETLLASQARLDTARYRLARALKGLQPITGFAEPLLAERLKRDHQFQAPLHTTELVWLHHLFTHQVYVTTHERRSLLEAALHNFADDVGFSHDSALALQGDTKVRQVMVTGKTTLGDSDTEVDIALASEQFEIKTLPLAPALFAATCRDLDLGGQYQQHLDSQFARAEVRPSVIALYKASLRVSADLARLHHRISGAAVDVVQRLLEDDSSCSCQQLELFGVTLHEALMIDGGEAGLLLYLPRHQASLRAFSDIDALQAQLREDLLAPTFRTPFNGYLPKAQQAAFLSRARQNLDTSTATGHDQPWTLPTDADLHLKRVDISAPLFDFLHDDHLARLKIEARLFAVPTAEADEQARKRRLAEWQSLGLNALMAASFVIPAAGVVMLAVTACQLLEETYEGYQAWSVGDRHEALGHLKVVGLNLAILAGLGAAGAVAGRLSSTPLMESLAPVDLGDGSQRLWRPDLSPYRLQSRTAVAEGAQPLRIDGQWYQRRFDAQLQRWRLVHPSTLEAYQPLLAHDGEGAWRIEHERPQDWALSTLVKRLDASLEQVTPEQLEQVARISGVNDAQLRELHLTNVPPPPLLADTLSRLKARQLTTTGQGQAFAEAYEASLPVHPHEAWMLQHYPTLGAPLCRRVLRSMSTTELAAWNSERTLPVRLADVARRLEAELPLARGLEGLYLPEMANDHSQRLLLKALTTLEGWPQETRIEVRADGPRGRTLAMAGSRKATGLRVIIKTTQGYEPYLGERPAPAKPCADLGHAVLRVLSANERAAMGLTENAVALGERLATLVNAERQAYARQLRPFGESAWSRRGYLSGGAPMEPEPVPEPQPAPINRTLYRQVQQIYPNLSEAGIEEFFSAARLQGLNPEQAVTALNIQFRAFDSRLAEWATGSPQRTRATAQLRSAWRGTSHQRISGQMQFSLSLADIDLSDTDLASLALPDHFPHIQLLDLARNPRLTTLPDTLLARFPNLQALTLDGCALRQIPQLSNPQALRLLDLEDNQLIWDDQAQQRLDQMVNLRTLDLTNNPLRHPPSIVALRELDALMLGGCGLSEFPAGLANMRAPDFLNLSENRFTQLPQPQPLAEPIAQMMHLESQHMSEAMTAQVNAYYVRYGVDLMVAAHEYEALLSRADEEELAVWERLPLQYRRDLRQLTEDDAFNAAPDVTLAEIWRRLHLLDQSQALRELAIADGAGQLLALPFPPPPALEPIEIPEPPAPVVAPEE